MKRYSILTLIFVLTAALMVGCGCTGPNMEDTTPPTVLPTNEEVIPTTRETTQPATQPTTQSTTEPTVTTETIDRGNGPLEDMTEDITEATETTGVNGNGSAGRSITRG